MDLKLTQRELAERLNVSKDTVRFWEKNQANPSLAKIPKIIEFLGYDPFAKKSENQGDRIREYRRVNGLTQKNLARLLAVDPSTIGAWENSEYRPAKVNLERLVSILRFEVCSCNHDE
jgi:transcriptional regulator with XRE-family HTH domain